jgi:NADPH:quinone reductase-like Zn-dependent oxidoreductase
LKRLGSDHIINYRDDKDWGITARNLTTDGIGFDHVVEIGGAETMSHSLKAVKIEGTITVIGLVTGFDAPDNIMEVLKKIVTLRGIHVGSKVHFEEMMAGMEANDIQPVLDQEVFKLEELRNALEYMVSFINFPCLSG